MRSGQATRRVRKMGRKGGVGVVVEEGGVRGVFGVVEGVGDGDGDGDGGGGMLLVLLVVVVFVLRGGLEMETDGGRLIGFGEQIVGFDGLGLGGWMRIG